MSDWIHEYLTATAAKYKVGQRVIVGKGAPCCNGEDAIIKEVHELFDAVGYYYTVGVENIELNLLENNIITPAEFYSVDAPPPVPGACRHIWVTVGHSPVLDTQWINCKLCNVAKEDV